VLGGLLADRRHAVGDGEDVVAIGLRALAFDDELHAALGAGHLLQQAGGQAEDRADVDLLALARRAPRPVIAPARERAEDGHELTRALCQLIVDARRDLAVPLACQQTVGDHPVQSRAQLLGGDAGEHPLELHEPSRTGREVTDDQQCPLVSDEVKRPSVR
jgi:hypothetical protein